MTIGFTNIPSTLKIPLFWAEFTNRAALAGGAEKRAVLVGQCTTVLTAALTFVQSEDQAAALFGAGSHLAEMVRAFRRSNPLAELWAIPLVDAGSSVAATQTLAFAGTSTAAGVIYLYVAGKLLTVAVASGTAAAAVATAVAAAVNADTTLPVTAGAASGTVTLTARNKGTLGNDIDVRVNYLGYQGNEALPAGITATVTGPSNGAVDPDLSVLDAIIGDEEFEVFVVPYATTTTLDAIKTLMDDTTGRWSWVRQDYGHVYSAKRGTAAGLLTFGAGRNDQHVTVVGYPQSPSPPWAHAAAYGAQALASVAADPGRPFQTLPLVGILAPPAGGDFTTSQKQSLLSTGVALESYARDGSASILRAVTTYQSNSFGVTDRSYLDAETMHLLAEIVRRLRSSLTQKFPRSKLVADGTRFGAGQPIVTPKSIKAELIAQYATMESAGLVENTPAFAAATIVERNATDPSRVDILYAPDLANGLRILAVLTEFRS